MLTLDDKNVKKPIQTQAAGLNGSVPVTSQQTPMAGDTPLNNMQPNTGLGLYGSIKKQQQALQLNQSGAIQAGQRPVTTMDSATTRGVNPLSSTGNSAQDPIVSEVATAKSGVPQAPMPAPLFNQQKPLQLDAATPAIPSPSIKDAYNNEGLYGVGAQLGASIGKPLGAGAFDAKQGFDNARESGLNALGTVIAGKHGADLGTNIVHGLDNLKVGIEPASAQASGGQMIQTKPLPLNPAFITPALTNQPSQPLQLNNIASINQGDSQLPVSNGSLMQTPASASAPISSATSSTAAAQNPLQLNPISGNGTAKDSKGNPLYSVKNDVVSRADGAPTSGLSVMDMSGMRRAYDATHTVDARAQALHDEGTQALLDGNIGRANNRYAQSDQMLVGNQDNALAQQKLQLDQNSPKQQLANQTAQDQLNATSADPAVKALAIDNVRTRTALTPDPTEKLSEKTTEPNGVTHSNDRIVSTRTGQTLGTNNMSRNNYHAELMAKIKVAQDAGRSHEDIIKTIMSSVGGN